MQNMYIAKKKKKIWIGKIIISIIYDHSLSCATKQLSVNIHEI